MQTNLSFSVFTANLISAMLICTLYCSNRNQVTKQKDRKLFVIMMTITLGF